MSARLLVVAVFYKVAVTKKGHVELLRDQSIDLFAARR